MNNKTNSTIAIVITGLSFGGAERVTSYLANYFVERGRNVHIISLTKGEHAYPITNEVTITEFDADNDSSPLRRYAKLIRLIRTKIREIKPSVVLGMMSYSGGLASIACLGLGIPLIISERNNPYTSYGFTNREKRILRLIYRTFVTKAVFQCRAAQSFYYKDTDTRGVIIPNPLFLDALPKPRNPVEKIVKILSAGRLNEQKNHALLIQAFARVVEIHPLCHLTIFGEGEEREKLEALVSKLGLDNSVKLPGIVEQIFPHLLEGDAFVLSSDYEGMPNALIEAMAIGLPSITTDYSGGRGTVIENGINGLVVPIRDVDALAGAIKSLIENPEQAKFFSRNALAIRKSLDSQIISGRWLKLIEETEKQYYGFAENRKDK